MKNLWKIYSTVKPTYNSSNWHKCVSRALYKQVCARARPRAHARGLNKKEKTMKSCPFVKKAFYTGKINKETGKNEVIIASRNKKWIYNPNAINQKLTEYIEIPCGECEICKANQAQAKAERAIAEAESHENNCVINLTYNDENLPININKETGTVTPTLKYKDFQDFKKRLLQHYKRKYNQENIRFMVAGEYGEQYKRPHYHAIFFNLDIKDKKEHGKTKKGSKEYTSEEIQKLWGKGYTTIGEVNQSSIQYIANYCLKKFKGKEAKRKYEELGIQPEFVQSSRRPGLGHEYLIKNKEKILENNKSYINTNNGTIEIHRNKYFDRLIEKENPEIIKNIKKERNELQKAREQTRALITKTDIETTRINQYNQFIEKIKKAKIRNQI